MARKPREIYTREEVDLMLVSSNQAMLAMVVDKLVNSGADASPEIGECLMHFSQGFVHYSGQMATRAKQAQVDELRSERLKEVVDGNLRG